MSNVKDRLEELGKKIKDGSATLGDVDDFKYVLCQQNFLEMKLSGLDDVMKMEKATMVSFINAMGIVLFFGEWDQGTNSVEATIEKD